MSAASCLASASSPSGYVSESAVTSTARSPTASLAARASSVESTPPEKATTTLSSSRIASSSRVYFASSAASMTSARSGHVGQWCLGPGSHVGDHLGRRERAEPAARRQVHPAAQSEEKTGRVEVARPGGVDDG